jgi:hypothetical protein
LSLLRMKKLEIHYVDYWREGKEEDQDRRYGHNNRIGVIWQIDKIKQRQTSFQTPDPERTEFGTRKLKSALFGIRMISEG